MKKIIIAALAVITLVTAVFAVGAFAADEPTVVTTGYGGTLKNGEYAQNITWNFYDNGVLEISGTGDMGAYGSASKQPWYAHQLEIKSVIINEGITRIGSFAFSGCTNLASVTFNGSDLKELGPSAFNQCKGLTTLKLPSSVQSFTGAKVLYGCSNLQILELPSGLATKSGNTDSFSSVSANVIFYTDASNEVVLNSNTLACLKANGKNNSISVRTPAGQINFDENASTALEAATSDVTATISASKNSSFYTYNASISGATVSSSVSYAMNYEKGLDANYIRIEGAGGADYDPANGILTFSGALGTVKAYEKIAFLGVAPNVSEDINLYFTTKLPSYYSNAKMTFNFRGNETVVDTYTVKNGKPAFKFADIRPEFMAEAVSATLSADFGGNAYSESINYSLKDYFTVALAMYADQPKTVDLINAMISYGAAAQVYQNYKVDELVSEGFDVTAPTAAPDASDLDIIGEACTEAQFAGVGLRCIDSMSVYYTFYAENTEGLTLSVTVNGRETTYNVSELTPDKNGKYRVDFEGVMAHEFGDIITATFKKDGVAIGQKIEYSVNSYVHHIVNNSTNANLLAIVKAIYSYGVAAKNYVK